ncbi:transposase [Alicyclobacillus tolerans]|uniref:transposase n=1 Tax=Alicyclobacillus tolerans TaxID=90970 RepID=UPI003B778BA1
MKFPIRLWKLIRTYVQKKPLTYRTTTREGHREYKSDPAICKTSPLLALCTWSRNQQKVLVRHVWEDSKERVQEYRFSKSGKRLYRLRMQTIERGLQMQNSFIDTDIRGAEAGTKCSNRH